jgi:hypothetical protein
MFCALSALITAGGNGVSRAHAQLSSALLINHASTIRRQVMNGQLCPPKQAAILASYAAYG